MRNAAGLSQQQLAELIGTTQSVISRLEDADYEGRSLSLLERIATALNQKLTVVMTAREPEELEIREAFHRVVQMLRRSRGLSIDDLAEKTEIDRTELVASTALVLRTGRSTGCRAASERFGGTRF